MKIIIMIILIFFFTGSILSADGKYKKYEKYLPDKHFTIQFCENVDLNKDGDQEILIGANKLYGKEPAGIFLLIDAKKSKVSFKEIKIGSFIDDLVTKDIDKDNELEILLSWRDSGSAGYLNAIILDFGDAFRVLWKNEKSLYRGGVAFKDINNDGLYEMIVTRALIYDFFGPPYLMKQELYKLADSSGKFVNSKTCKGKALVYKYLKMRIGLPKHLHQFIALAYDYFIRKEYAEALIIYKRIIKDYGLDEKHKKDIITAYLYSGKSCFNLGLKNEAEKYLNMMKSKFPKASEASELELILKK